MKINSFHAESMQAMKKGMDIKMSELKKGNDNFEFIKEQVIVKKHKKLKKWLFPFLMTVTMAILFGLISAVTFCIAEPRLYELLHRAKEEKTPVDLQDKDTEDIDDNDLIRPGLEDTNTVKPTPGLDKPAVQGEDPDINEEVKDPEPVIVERSIDADIDDYKSIYDDIKSIAYEGNKSVVKVSSIINTSDWFGNPVEREVETSGLVIANNNTELLILVSLDRVKDASAIDIIFSDTIAAKAELLDFESELNMAVIAVKLVDIPELYLKSIVPAKLGESYTIIVGSPIIAIGSPNGHPESVEVGIITSKGSHISLTDNRLDLFNTNIQSNDNSDGFIINLNGEVIGIITRNLKEDLNKDLSTALGISKIRSIITKLANETPRIYFGVRTDDMTEAAKAEHGVENGIYVETVQANSPAFAGGLKTGDIIIEVDEALVTNTNRFYSIISEYNPGDKVKVKIKRTSNTNEKDLVLDVIVQEKANK